MPHLDNKEIMDIHIPRWEELPSIGLYMNQTLQFIKDNISFLKVWDNDKFITSTMVNNYVNQNIIPSPINKQYNKQHLAYLIVICILKQVYSMNEIKELLKYQSLNYSDYQAFDYFCNEFEICLKDLSLNKDVKHFPSEDENTLPVHMIRNTLLSVCTKLYVQNTLNNISITKD